MAEFSNLLGYDVKDAKARNSIENLENSYDTQLEQITDLENNNKTSDDITIIIGDSYLNGVATDATITATWGEIFKNNMGLSDDECIISARNGSGFTVSENTFKTILESVTVANPNKVKRIIVMGGYNDKGNVSSIVSAIETFCDKAKQLYPNAQVYCCFIAWYYNGGNYTEMMDGKEAYRKALKSNYTYMHSLESALHGYGLMSGDNFHPNQNGQNKIGECLTRYFTNTRAVNSVNQNCTFKWVTGDAYTNVKYMHIGDCTNIFFTGFKQTLSTPLTLKFNWNEFEIGTLEGFSGRAQNNFAGTTVQFIAKKETGGYFDFVGRVYVKGCKVYMTIGKIDGSYMADTNITEIQTGAFNILIPGYGF